MKTGHKGCGLSIPAMTEEDMNEAVKAFAVDVLGCNCPEEVFSTIEFEKSPDPVGGVDLIFQILIGGRLMVLGLKDSELREPCDSLARVVAEGVTRRDRLGFNRLRIVVVSDDPGCGARLKPLFEGIPGKDDRVHLHVLRHGDIRPLMEENGERRYKMDKLKTEPTVWHEMEGPFIGGREHYQEKSYGFVAVRQTDDKGEKSEDQEGGE
jgi:hypothetical protein